MESHKLGSPRLLISVANVRSWIPCPDRRPVLVDDGQSSPFASRVGQPVVDEHGPSDVEHREQHQDGDRKDQRELDEGLAPGATSNQGCGCVGARSRPDRYDGFASGRLRIDGPACR